MNSFFSSLFPARISANCQFSILGWILFFNWKSIPLEVEQSKGPDKWSKNTDLFPNRAKALSGLKLLSYHRSTDLPIYRSTNMAYVAPDSSYSAADVPWPVHRSVWSASVDWDCDSGSDSDSYHRATRHYSRRGNACWWYSSCPVRLSKIR